MNQEEKQMVDEIMESESVGYAYLYSNNGKTTKEYFVSTLPKNLANFVGKHLLEAEKIMVTDMADRLMLYASSGSVNQCRDQNLKDEISKMLKSMQMGEPVLGEILAVDREVAEECFWEEEQAITMAEWLM